MFEVLIQSYIDRVIFQIIFGLLLSSGHLRTSSSSVRQTCHILSAAMKDGCVVANSRSALFGLRMSQCSVRSPTQRVACPSWISLGVKTDPHLQIVVRWLTSDPELRAAWRPGLRLAGGSFGDEPVRPDTIFMNRLPEGFTKPTTGALTLSELDEPAIDVARPVVPLGCSFVSLDPSGWGDIQSANRNLDEFQGGEPVASHGFIHHSSVSEIHIPSDPGGTVSYDGRISGGVRAVESGTSGGGATDARRTRGGEREEVVPQSSDTCGDDMAAPARTEAGPSAAAAGCSAPASVCGGDSQVTGSAERRGDAGLTASAGSRIGESGRRRTEKAFIQMANGSWVGLPPLTLGEVVGNGTFGVVYAARLESGERVAVKRVMQEPRIRNRELSVLKSLRHPHIVGLHSYFYTVTQSATPQVYLNLVMEYMPETLHRLIRCHGKAREVLPIQQTKVYAWQILRALAYLHALNIVHRDIKPHNVLIDTTSHLAKLCDLGSAKALYPGATSIAYICSRFYRAPELVVGRTDYSTAVDMWSFGCVLGEMLLGRPIFAGENSIRQLAAMARILGPPASPDRESLGGNATLWALAGVAPAEAPRLAGGDSDSAALSGDAARRQAERSFRSVGWQPFAKAKAPVEAVDLLSQVLAYRPEARLTAVDCLAHPFFRSLRLPDPASASASASALPLRLFDFTREEEAAARQRGLWDKIAGPAAAHPPPPPPLPSQARQLVGSAASSASHLADSELAFR